MTGGIGETIASTLLKQATQRVAADVQVRLRGPAARREAARVEARCLTDLHGALQDLADAFRLPPSPERDARIAQALQAVAASRAALGNRVAAPVDADVEAAVRATRTWQATHERHPDPAEHVAVAGPRPAHLLGEIDDLEAVYGRTAATGYAIHAQQHLHGALGALENTSSLPGRDRGLEESRVRLRTPRGAAAELGSDGRDGDTADRLEDARDRMCRNASEPGLRAEAEWARAEHDHVVARSDRYLEAASVDDAVLASWTEHVRRRLESEQEALARSGRHGGPELETHHRRACELEDRLEQLETRSHGPSR